MPKYKYNKINILFSCCLLVSFVVAPLVVQAQEDPFVTQAREAAKEAKPLVQELLHLKNQQQFEKVEQNFEKAQRFLEDNRPNQEDTVTQLKSATAIQTITKITIDLGGEEISLDFDEVIKHYLNQPLSTKTVFALTKELTQVLYNAGYVTSAIGLKSSKIKNGEVEFVVLWGKVNDILVEDKQASLFKDKAMLLVLPNLKGKVLRIYDVDQLIEILNTGNKTAKVNVIASDKKSMSNLSIERQRTSYPQVTFGMNNSGEGSNAEGRNQATLSVSWSDMLGTNDRWSFSTGYRIYKDRQANRQQNYSLSYAQPFSFSTLEIKLSYSGYKKQLRGIHTHGSRGETKQASLKLSHTLLRNKDMILSLYGELEFKRRLSYFGDIRIGKYHNNKLNIGLSYVTNLGHGKLYSDLSYSNGLRWFNANHSAHNSHRDKTLRLVSGSINWQRPFVFFNRGMSYQFRLGAQYGFDSLYGENQFSIGDEYTVRGFKGGAGSGDRGFYISQTVTIPFYPQKSYLSYINPFLGIDIGKVHAKRPHHVVDTFAGVAFGVKAQIKSLALSLTYAKPINGVGTFEESNKKSVFYFTGSVSF